MRLGIDIDGVMYQWSKTARYMLREVLPYSPYTKDGPMGKESTHWDYIMENIAPEHWKWLWSDGVRLGLFRHGHMYPGTIQAIRRLAEIGEIIIITHRPKCAVADTMAWLSYQQLPLAGIHVLTNQEPKSSVIPHCDVYLDDKPENCEDLARTRGRVCLMDRDWNRHVDCVGTATNPVWRVRTWKEFEHLVSIRREMSA